MKIHINENFTYNVIKTREQAEEFQRTYTDESLLNTFLLQTGTIHEIIRNYDIMYCDLSPTYKEEEKQNQYHVEIGLKNFSNCFNIIIFYIKQSGEVLTDDFLYDIELYELSNRFSDGKREEDTEKN